MAGVGTKKNSERKHKRPRPLRPLSKEELDFRHLTYAQIVCHAEHIDPALVDDFWMASRSSASLAQLSREVNSLLVKKGRKRGSKNSRVASLAGVIILKAIEWCAEMRKVPPPELAALAGTFFRAEKIGGLDLRLISGRYLAAIHLADNPSAGTNELARVAGVAPSAVSQWKKSGVLNKLVKVVLSRPAEVELWGMLVR